MERREQSGVNDIQGATRSAMRCPERADSARGRPSAEEPERPTVSLFQYGNEPELG